MPIDIFKLYKIKKLAGAPESDFAATEDVAAATYKLAKDGRKVRTKIIDLNKPLDKPDMKEELKGNQHKLDYNKDGKISADDLHNIRKKKVKTKIEELKKSKGDPCWKGYVQLGTKDKDGKKVPNCVPESVEEIEELSKDTLSSYYSKAIGDRHSKDLERDSEKRKYDRDDSKVDKLGKKIFNRSQGLETAKKKFFAKEDSVEEAIKPSGLTVKYKKNGDGSFNAIIHNSDGSVKKVHTNANQDTLKKLVKDKYGISEGFVPFGKPGPDGSHLKKPRVDFNRMAATKKAKKEYDNMSQQQRLDKIKNAIQNMKKPKTESHIPVGSELNCGKEKLKVKKHIGKDGYLVKADESIKEPETTKDKTDVKLPAPVKGGKLHGEIPSGYKSNGKKMHGSMTEKDNTEVWHPTGKKGKSFKDGKEHTEYERFEKGRPTGQRHWRDANGKIVDESTEI